MAIHQGNSRNHLPPISCSSKEVQGTVRKFTRLLYTREIAGTIYLQFIVLVKWYEVFKVMFTRWLYTRGIAETIYPQFLVLVNTYEVL